MNNTMEVSNEKNLFKVGRLKQEDLEESNVKTEEKSSTKWHTYKTCFFSIRGVRKLMGVNIKLV
jgi:hypothetical protein